MKHARAPWVTVLLLALSAVVFTTLVSLGTWQVKRLAWKRDLIAQIEARAFAPAVPAPLGDAPAYLNVATDGTFTDAQTLHIKAVTDIGAGFWVMTPFVTQDQTIWVNRGYVPTRTNTPDWAAPVGLQTINGLARLPVPNGTWLESNMPDTGRWVSADLSAMSAQTGITANTAFYIDAAHTGIPTAYPRGGMTQLTLRNTHLSYAITWYAMAALLAAGLGFVIWDHRRPQCDTGHDT